MSSIRLSLSTLFLITPAALAADLRIETALPERTAIAVSLTGGADLHARLSDAGVFEAMAGDDEDAQQVWVDALIEQMPGPVADAITQAIGDEDPFAVLSAMDIGFGAWPADVKGFALPAEGAAWMNLGDKAAELGAAIDEALNAARRQGDAESTTVRGVDVDKFIIGGPDDLLCFAHVSPWLIAGSTESAMDHMLEVLQDGPADTPLGETEAWVEASAMMKGNSGLRLVAFPEVIQDLYQLSPDGQMLGMIRPVTGAVLGQHEVMSLRVSPGEGDQILNLDGGSWMPGGAVGLLLPFQQGNIASDAQRMFAGPDTVSVLRMNVDLPGLPDIVGAIIKSSPMLFMAQQPWDQMKPMVETFVKPLGTQITQISWIERPITADSMQSLFAVDVQDRQAMADALSGTLAEAGFESREFVGHEIWSITTAGMLPGAPDQTTAMAAAGGFLLFGTDASVEWALRHLGSRAAQPDWLVEAPSSGDMAAVISGVMHLGDMLGTIQRIAELENARIARALQAEDPELWELLSEDTGDTDAWEEAQRLAGVLGVLSWQVDREDTAITISATVIAAP
ncbi:MAG: hypothetical protein MK074_04205 [Phycisphaerales bacterium]|nr:hypothetical protein [Phycisphaerales bacterium]